MLMAMMVVMMMLIIGHCIHGAARPLTQVLHVDGDDGGDDGGNVDDCGGDGGAEDLYYHHHWEVSPDQGLMFAGGKYSVFLSF